jgi:hypothetical protein
MSKNREASKSAEEQWSLTPERMAEIRREASTGLGLDNGYASTVILEAFDVIDRLRAQVNRRCECGELVDYPENIHCGACA